MEKGLRECSLFFYCSPFRVSPLFAILAIPDKSTESMVVLSIYRNFVWQLMEKTIFYSLFSLFQNLEKNLVREQKNWKIKLSVWMEKTFSMYCEVSCYAYVPFTYQLPRNTSIVPWRVTIILGFYKIISLEKTFKLVIR